MQNSNTFLDLLTIKKVNPNEVKKMDDLSRINLNNRSNHPNVKNRNININNENKKNIFNLNNNKNINNFRNNNNNDINYNNKNINIQVNERFNKVNKDLINNNNLSNIINLKSKEQKSNNIIKNDNINKNNELLQLLQNEVKEKEQIFNEEMINHNRIQNNKINIITNKEDEENIINNPIRRSNDGLIYGRMPMEEFRWRPEGRRRYDFPIIPIAQGSNLNNFDNIIFPIGSRRINQRRFIQRGRDNLFDSSRISNLSQNSSEKNEENSNDSNDSNDSDENNDSSLNIFNHSLGRIRRRGEFIMSRTITISSDDDSEISSSNDIIDKFPVSDIKDINKLSDDNKRCCICLEDYKDNDKGIYLPCLHLFHKDCISKWLRRKKFCPFCKLEINQNNLGNDF